LSARLGRAGGLETKRAPEHRKMETTIRSEEGRNMARLPQAPKYSWFTRLMF
jgi:hypothetical protein